MSVINRYEKERERTRLAFMNAALSLILEKGYDNVSVSEIVTRADYGRSTFYEHFPDKEEIAWAILEHHFITLNTKVAEATRHLPSPEHEWLGWLMTCRDIHKQRQFFIQMDGELSRRLRQRQKNLWLASCEEAYRNADAPLLAHVPPEIRATFVVGAVLEIFERWLTHPEMGTPEDVARTIFTLLYRIDPPDANF